MLNGTMGLLTVLDSSTSTPENRPPLNKMKNMTNFCLVSVVSGKRACTEKEKKKSPGFSRFKDASGCVHLISNVERIVNIETIFTYLKYEIAVDALDILLSRDGMDSVFLAQDTRKKKIISFLIAASI